MHMQSDENNLRTPINTSASKHISGKLELTCQRCKIVYEKPEAHADGCVSRSDRCVDGHVDGRCMQMGVARCADEV